MKQGLRQVVRGMASVTLAALVVSLTGCDGFFVKPGTGTGGTTGTTGSYVYASNAVTSATSLAVYGLASGTPVPVTGSPFSLGFVPSGLVVRPGNAFLYASSLSTGFTGIYLYTIATATGIPTIANGGSAVAAQTVVSMDVSPDGKYLFALDANGSTFTQYAINSTTGLLSFVSTSTFVAPLGTIAAPTTIKVAPSGSFVVCTLGTAGDVIFPLSSTGVVSASYVSLPIPGTSTAVGDYGVTLDSSNFMYLARTGGIAVYSLSSAGVPTLITGSPFAAGTGTRSIVISNGSLYAANQTDGTISAYSVAGTGALTNLAGSPYTSAGGVTAMGVDNSGKYLVALGYDSAGGFRVYAIGTGGSLSSASSSIATGKDLTVPAVMALTH